MALPMKFYKDPSALLEELEMKTCRGCRHLGKLLGKDFCEHPARSSGKADQRCRHYKTTEEE